MLTAFNLTVLIKLSLSALLGLVIGLEREIKRKQLGFKTCLVISISSCLLTIISIESAYQFKGTLHPININMDPLRLAAQIVSGVGFIGAGVILKKGHDSVSGLTTAALIWSASGIGISVGAGFYLAATIAVSLLIISVEFLPYLFSFLGLKPLGEKEIILRIDLHDRTYFEPVLSSIKLAQISINHVYMKDIGAEQQLNLKVAVEHKKDLLDVYHYISSIEGIRGVEMETI